MVMKPELETAVWHPDTNRFPPGASSGLTQCRRVKGVTLGELGEPDPQAGDGLGELGELR